MNSIKASAPWGNFFCRVGIFCRNILSFPHFCASRKCGNFCIKQFSPRSLLSAHLIKNKTKCHQKPNLFCFLLLTKITVNKLLKVGREADTPLRIVGISCSTKVGFRSSDPPANIARPPNTRLGKCYYLSTFSNLSIFCLYFHRKTIF